MDRRLIRQFDALAGDQFNFQPGRIHGILLIFSGTNDTAQTGTLADLGSVVVTRDGRQIVNATIEDIADMGDIRFGSNLFSSVAAGAFLASAFIPFFESSDDDAVFNNALSIVGEEELNFEWVPASTIDTVFIDISARVFSELAAYNENYEYRILRDNPDVPGALAGKPIQLNKNNISAIYLRDVDDVIDLVQLEQNGRSVYSPQDFDALEAGTLRDNRLEVTTFDLVELQTYTKGNLASVVNRNSVMSLTTSATGTVRLLTTSLHIWN